jgi:hypothetical protein
MRYILFLLAVTAFTSCKENEPECADVGITPLVINYCESNENFSNTPLLENPTVSRSQVSGNLDSITIKFDFKDGDGDIGELEPDTTSYNLCDLNTINTAAFSMLFVEDTRTGCFVNYHLEAIPVESGSITGEMEVTFNSICCIYGGDTACIPSTQYPTDTVIFKIRMKDRAGNISNLLTTPPVYINCNY